MPDVILKTTEDTVKAIITEHKITAQITGNINFTTLVFEWVAVPLTRNSFGTPGQMSYDDDYFYLCVATSNWARTMLMKGW